MSGLEVERLQERVQGMTVEQQRVTAASLPDKILWEAVYERFLRPKSRVVTIEQTITIEI